MPSTECNPKCRLSVIASVIRGIMQDLMAAFHPLRTHGRPAMKSHGSENLACSRLRVTVLRLRTDSRDTTSW